MVFVLVLVCVFAWLCACVLVCLCACVLVCLCVCAGSFVFGRTLSTLLQREANNTEQDTHVPPILTHASLSGVGENKWG